MIKAILLLITMILIAGCTSRNVIKSDKGAEAQSHYKIIRHDLKVVLNPKEHRFIAEDTITVPEHLKTDLRFRIHSGFKIEPDVAIIKEGVIIKSEDVPIESFLVRLPYDTNTFTLKYSGAIHYPLEQDGKEEARGIKQTLGIISEEGVYLEKESYWYPVFDNGLVTFNLHIELPSEWDAVSQGERLLHVK
ncbi:MAG: hypothetical protein HY034_00825, partial [Nitrospirae bacterium]|nr:hypothetical protein [Nitrospirota bacterium]